MTTNCKQDRPVLVSKPSNVSTTSSAASATSVASSVRSGGSRLLFGEIDTSSQRSTDSYASVCSLVLCDSSTFLKFWLNDDCRERFIGHVPSTDLQNLRLVCHDFSVRTAPALFNDLNITFKTSTFTRPARLAALDRVGYHVKRLRFNLAHSAQTFLPPLVDPETGDELSFTYTPQVVSNPKLSKYGDCGTTEILTRQYPPLFHAATNVPAFIRAFSSLVNLKDLEISCPGYDATALKYRRSVVDFALVSVRIAVERSHLNALESLTLSPIHPGALQYLSPAIGYGADPRSMRCWARIRKLRIDMNAPPPAPSHVQREKTHASEQQQQRRQQLQQPAADHFKVLQSYLRNFQRNLTHFNFHWIGTKSPIPIYTLSPMPARPEMIHPALKAQSSPSTKTSSPSTAVKPHNFPNLTHFELENVTATASEIHNFVALHKRTLRELNLENIELTSGAWDEALAPLTPLPPRTPVSQNPSSRARTAERSTRSSNATTLSGMDEIPIMLSPTTTTTPERKAVPPPLSRTPPSKPQRSNARVPPLSPPLASPLLLLKPTIFKPATSSKSSNQKSQHPITATATTTASASASAGVGAGSLRISQRILSTVHSTMHPTAAASTSSASTATATAAGGRKKDETSLRRVLREGMLGLRGDFF